MFKFVVGKYIIAKNPTVAFGDIEVEPTTDKEFTQVIRISKDDVFKLVGIGPENNALWIEIDGKYYMTLPTSFDIHDYSIYDVKENETFTVVGRLGYFVIPVGTEDIVVQIFNIPDSNMFSDGRPLRHIIHDIDALAGHKINIISNPRP